MSNRVRMTILFFIALAVVPLASAKNKKKQPLPNYVLKAQTVAVVIPPEAGEPLTSPAANRTAQVNVMNECIVEMGQIQGGVGFTDRGLDRSRTEGTCEWPNDPQFPRGLPTGYPRWRCSPFRWRSCPPCWREPSVARSYQSRRRQTVNENTEYRQRGRYVGR